MCFDHSWPTLFPAWTGKPFSGCGRGLFRFIAEILEKQSPHFDRVIAPALSISYPDIYLEEERGFFLSATNSSFRLGALKALEKGSG